jgi:hypothetical protein
VSRDVQSERQAHQQLEGNPAKFDQQIGEKESAAEVRTRTIRRRNGGNKEMTGKHAPTRLQGLHQLDDLEVGHVQLWVIVLRLLEVLLSDHDALCKHTTRQVNDGEKSIRRTTLRGEDRHLEDRWLHIRDSEHEHIKRECVLMIRHTHRANSTKETPRGPFLER